MKAWDWISMRRSLEDAVKNAFEKTRMKNVPIDQFWSFKWRNGVQNWNLREKRSKIGPVGNFDFWSKVNAKKSKSKSTGLGSKSTDTGPGRFRVSGSGHRSSSRADDVILWRVADVADDVSRAYVAADVEWWRHQVTSAVVFRRVRSPSAREGDAVNLGGACDVVWPPDSQAK